MAPGATILAGILSEPATAMPNRSRSRQFTTASRQIETVDGLASLLPLWPHELADTSLAGFEKRLNLLRRALRAERQRGISGHWAYDLGRHASLLRYYRREVAHLKALGGVATRP